ncbi:hypothetical protein [Reinekea blandensis]|uniref:hypothetical protein n=1 Tax=Reinekea blandensis TaxID=374838 RepID=UPI000305EFD9|nr:hypothetical protein [Reinekea blandensis]
MRNTALKVEAVFPTQLVGVYLFGSASYGQYVPGVSDLDIQAVIEPSVSDEQLAPLVEALLHRNHPCPATKLEFVLHTRKQLMSVPSSPYRLNLNTGPTIDDHVSMDAGEDPSHWFVLDIAIGRTRALPLLGKMPPERVFPAITSEQIAQAMIECLAWFAEHFPESEAYAQCLMRCYVFARHGELVSKKDAAVIAKKERATDIFSDRGAITRLHNEVVLALDQSG